MCLSQVILPLVHTPQYMSTEPLLSFSPATFGEVALNGNCVTNTCSQDGPLSWLMLAFLEYPKLMTMVMNKKIHFLVTHQLFESGNHVGGKSYFAGIKHSGLNYW